MLITTSAFLNVNGNLINAYALELNPKSLQPDSSKYNKANSYYKRVDSFYYVPQRYVLKEY